MKRVIATGRSAKRRADAKTRRSSVLPLAAVGLGALLNGVAWLFLVEAAIDFGVLAVNGEGAAWLFATGATLGAVMCLFLMLALIGRVLRTLGLFSVYEPRRRR